MKDLGIGKPRREEKKFLPDGVFEMLQFNRVRLFSHCVIMSWSVRYAASFSILIAVHYS